MLLRITHTTDLTYSDLISESVMELRMAPRQEMDQHRLSFELAIGPRTSVTSYFDWLDNPVHFFSISPFHSQIRIVATSVVETDRPMRDPTSYADRWPIEPQRLDHTIFDYVHFGGPVVDSESLRALVAELRPRHGQLLGALASDIMGLIDRRFVYEKGITNAASPITEVLEHGKGVCQDFTHLMIGMARALGIPARYVSGFIHPDAQRFRGYTQTHAWCELFFPDTGWLGFDPANRCAIGPNFVRVAVGRDFRDVSPNKGLYRGNAKETIDVKVHTEELPAIPPELVSERSYAIDIPSYLDGATAHREFMAQQQQIQQQS